MEKSKADKFDMKFHKNNEGYLWYKKDKFPNPTYLESIANLSNEKIKKIGARYKKFRPKR